MDIKAPLRLGWIFAQLRTHGGVISAIDMINSMDKNKFKPIIFTYDKSPELDKLPIKCPVISDSVRRLPQTIASRCDIVVATLWTTAYIVRAAKLINKNLKSLYFVQDYEPDFLIAREAKESKNPELVLQYLSDIEQKDFAKVWNALEHLNHMRIPEVVERTYQFIPTKVVKTNWLINTFKEKLGITPTKVPFGLDTTRFTPANQFLVMANLPNAPFKVLGFARPSTPRRGFEYLVKIFSRIASKRDDIELCMFGTNDLSKYRIPFKFTNLGEIKNAEMPYVYGSHNVFIDSSVFQGFGRPGLEAMACGCVSVLSESGGIREYAQNLHNCIIYSNTYPEDAANAICLLKDNIDLRKQLIRNGLDTAENFSVNKSAQILGDIFLKLKT